MLFWVQFFIKLNLENAPKELTKKLLKTSKHLMLLEALILLLSVEQSNHTQTLVVYIYEERLFMNQMETLLLHKE